jgi:hypothetical protein
MSGLREKPPALFVRHEERGLWTFQKQVWLWDLLGWLGLAVAASIGTLRW